MQKKILIIRFGSLGDIVLTSSAITNLKIDQPDCKVFYLCKEKFRPVVEMIDGVDKIITVDNNISTFRYLSFLINLDRENFSSVLDLHGNFRSWLARRFIHADRKIVYPKRRLERTMAVKKKVIPEHYPHTIDLYNQTVLDLGGRSYLNRPLLKCTEEVPSDLHQFFKLHKEVILFAPGAAYPTKQFDVSKFAESAISLQKERGCGILWAVTKEQESSGNEFQSVPVESIKVLVDTPLQDLTAIIAESDLTIANDSGIGHISSAVNTPVISLFGPTHPVLGFAPRGLYDRVIQVEEPCRPCSLHGKKECYREERFCFTRIDSERIVKLAKHKLDSCRMKEKAVFIDRDGTIIVEKHFLSNPDEIEFIEGSVDALAQLQKHEYKLIIVSNQSGVARGKFGEETVEKVNCRMVELLAARKVYIDAVYYCPHHPKGTIPEYSRVCTCRKPSPQMVEDAIAQFGINPRQSFVVGDKIDDINLAKVVGAKGILVRTGYGLKHQPIVDEFSFYHEVKIRDNLAAAEECINRMICYD